MSSESETEELERNTDEFREDMSVDEVAQWLKKKGIPETFCSIMKDNYIDGTEFVKLTDQDVKGMITAVGIAKKICRLVPKAEVPHVSGGSLDSEKSPSSSDKQPSVSPSPSPSPSPSLASSGKLSSDNFDIPTHWRPETNACIQKKVLTRECRSDIIRTLVTLTISKVGPRPTRSHCQQVCRKLILQYSFMKDDIGDGYTSWVEKMLERIRNLVKADRKKSKESSTQLQPTPKRSKANNPDDLLRRYPVTVCSSSTLEDRETIDQHLKALTEEMHKAKPRDRVLLPLMKTTFPSRWLFITKDVSSVKEIIETYPALKLPTVLEQEMSLIVDRSDIKKTFVREWMKFVPAIISYGEKCTSKSIQTIVTSFDAISDDGKQIAALKVLCETLTPRTSKDAIKFIYCEHQSSVPVSEASRGVVAPAIGTYNFNESKQYFIFVEGDVLCQLSTFSEALFIMFSSYYAFSLEYPKQVKNVMFLIQDYIFCYPDSLGRSASYLATASDIKRNI